MLWEQECEEMVLLRTGTDLEQVCRVQWPLGRWAGRCSPAAAWALPHPHGFQSHSWHCSEELEIDCRNTIACVDLEACADAATALLQKNAMLNVAFNEKWTVNFRICFIMQFSFNWNNLLVPVQYTVCSTMLHVLRSIFCLKLLVCNTYLWFFKLFPRSNVCDSFLWENKHCVNMPATLNI